MREGREKNSELKQSSEGESAQTLSTSGGRERDTGEIGETQKIEVGGEKRIRRIRVF